MRRRLCCKLWRGTDEHPRGCVLKLARTAAQDELVQALRSEGRRQAAQRMLRIKRDGQMMLSSPDNGFDSE